METILATSPQCGPCQIVKKYITENKLEITIKDLTYDLPFFKEHKITSVPQLLVMDGDTVTERFYGSPDILNYLQP